MKLVTLICKVSWHTINHKFKQKLDFTDLSWDMLHAARKSKSSDRQVLPPMKIPD